MASQSAFINVLEGPSGPSKTTFYITSKNNPTPLSLSIEVDFSAQMTEKAAAEYICEQLNAAFLTQNCYYGDFPNGTPQFEQTSGYYQVLLRAFCVDHVVNVWSQAQFQLLNSAVIYPTAPTPNTADPVPSGTIVCSDGAIYTTLADFYRLNRINGVNPVSLVDGQPLDKFDIVNLMRSASDELRGLMGFEVVGCQYLMEIRGNNTTGFNFEHFPIIAWDYPGFDGPMYFQLGHNLTSLKSFYNVDAVNGTMDFGTVTAPLDYDVILKISYAAGLATVDSIVKQACMKLMRMQLQPQELLEMRGGSGSFKRDTQKNIRDGIRDMVNGLFV